MPDFDILVHELRRKGVTKKLLWEEYVNDCHATESIPFQYAQFCVHFNRYLEQTKATMYFQHSPGEKVEVDWAKCKALHFAQSISKISPGFRRIRIVALYFIA